MADVPQVPGVPPLSSYSSGLPTLMFSDVIDVARLFVPNLWGVFLNGIPVIVPASVVPAPVSRAVSRVAPLLAPLQTLASFLGAPSIILPVVASTIHFEFAQDWPISDYQQEQGAFQSYNKVRLPFDVKVSVGAGGSPSTRQLFLDTCLGIANSMSLFDIVTPEKIFKSCNVTHVDWRRSARHGVSLIIVDLWFKQIIVTATATFTTTASPAEAGQQGLGSVQPQPLPAPVAQALSGPTTGGGFF